MNLQEAVDILLKIRKGSVIANEFGITFKLKKWKVSFSIYGKKFKIIDIQINGKFDYTYFKQEMVRILKIINSKSAEYLEGLK